MKANILNFILFQLGWFVCILGAAYNYVYEAIFMSLVIIFLHLKVTKNNTNDLKLFIFALTIGFFFDGFLQLQQLIVYFNPGWPYPLPPLWILVLWVIFAMTLNHSLKWMKGRVLIAMLFGLIGGPLAYLAGEKLNAIILNSSSTLYILAIGWAIITPLLMKLSEKS